MLPEGSRKAASRGPQRLVGRLLDHLGAARGGLRERRVEVVGREHPRAERALDHELLERLAVRRRAARLRVGQHDLGAPRLTERDPAVAAGGDVLRDRQTERVTVERDHGALNPF